MPTLAAVLSALIELSMAVIVLLVVFVGVPLSWAWFDRRKR